METNMAQRQGQFRCRFKSYYVVWKLFLKIINKQNNNGLNRTMQYGNGGGFVKEKNNQKV